MVAIGLKDLVVVETIDAILVANKVQAQEVKNIVQNLEKKGKSRLLFFKTIYDHGEIILLLHLVSIAGEKVSESGESLYYNYIIIELSIG